ncbi:family 43 glycosylhydrolase [Schaalia sp. ZJ1691]|uniref:family 43 glycosylhydrolase n=1 Tax=Schaalia sp. ZJ1691 TaxID=2709404 RepID=UPI0013EA931A|nr:family 43 glycosylhydrolase [Schaalia sp. ZJ1691]
MKITTPRLRRLVASAIAAPIALAGMTVSATAQPLAANNSPSLPTDNLIASYDFGEKPVDHKTVKNGVDGSPFGEAQVHKSSESQWTNAALTLVGGSKDTGNWVELPRDLLAGKNAATVQMEVKADPSMLNSFHFLWNIGNDSNNEYFFASLNCGNNRAPLVGTKHSTNERLVQARSCVAPANRWLSVTATTEDNTATLYIDGQKVASGTTQNLAGVVDQSLNTIGRSPWPDPLFKGSVSTLRVYDRAISHEEVQALSTLDAQRHKDELIDEAFSSISVPSEVNSPYLPLVKSVTWESSDPSVIDPATGKVTQPTKGSAPTTVTLTATTQVRGQGGTRSFAVTVNPSSKDADAILRDLADAYVLAPVVRSGDSLPQPPPGVTATVKSASGVSLVDGVLTNTGDSEVTGTVVVSLTKDTAAPIEKTFTVTVLPLSQSGVLAAYDRNATTVEQANNGDIAYSTHLALQQEDGSFLPYNENYGIFFAQLIKEFPTLEDTKESYARSLKDPSLFYMKDGSFGVVAVRTQRSSLTADVPGTILVATSQDLLSYTEKKNSQSLITVGETNGVNNPRIAYDSAAEHYVVRWNDDNGVAKYTTFATLDGSSATHGEVLIGDVSLPGTLEAAQAQGIDDFRSGATIPVRSDIVKKLDVRFARIVNTGYQAFTDMTVDLNASVDENALPRKVTLNYSDGSQRTLPISAWDLTNVDTSKAGEYTATATVKQNIYQIPFAEDRADPSVKKWEWTHMVNGTEVTETKFLMIATNDINGDCTWQHGTPHMPLRMADTIEALADNASTGELIDAQGYNPKEHVILKAGDTDADGAVIRHSFWAPEIHEINGRLTILFMAGYGSTWTNGHAVYMQLKQDANGYDLDPTVAQNWDKPVAVLRPDGKPLATTASGGVGMSLDMTYFIAGGQSYYAWQQLGATYIATMDPSNPARLTSMPVRIVAPEYAWNISIAEGANVHIRNGKAFLIYSGSAVGPRYTTGLAVADENADLTDPASWDVLNYPIQKSGPFNGAMQLGTGHGMWSEDEDGNQLYVFHAYATKNLGATNATGRDMFIRRIHWAVDGYPIFDMSQDEELNPETSITLKVRVKEAEETQAPDGEDPGENIGTDPGERPGTDPGNTPGDTPGSHSDTLATPGSSSDGDGSATSSSSPQKAGKVLALTGARGVEGTLKVTVLLGMVGIALAARARSRR